MTIKIIFFYFLIFNPVEQINSHEVAKSPEPRPLAVKERLKGEKKRDIENSVV